MEYCTCNFKWNLQGYAKGLSLFNFVLSAALVLQKLIIHVGLGGLLPGEYQGLAQSCQGQGVGLSPGVEGVRTGARSAVMARWFTV